MKSRPILFSAPMVRALLAGTKTQTRRIIKGSHALDLLNCGMTAEYVALPENYLCPYGQPGDQLWVREAFRFLDAFDGDSPTTVGNRCLAAGYPKPWAPIQHEADGWRDNWMNVGATPGSVTPGKLRPGIHMPRWASRITLEIVSVRVERLQDISEEDAIAEGTTPSIVGADLDHLKYRSGYQTLWESINGAGSWDANPWVWVIEFRRI